MELHSFFLVQETSLLETRADIDQYLNKLSGLPELF